MKKIFFTILLMCLCTLMTIQAQTIRKGDKFLMVVRSIPYKMYAWTKSYI